METVKQCREDGYRGKLKKENEDDDVARDDKRDIEEWINGGLAILSSILTSSVNQVRKIEISN